jgi:hypothetical protein
MSTTEEPGAADAPDQTQDAPEPAQDAETTGEPDVEPATEPDRDPADTHTGPLDDDEDGRFLPRDDPRRLEAEERRGRPFDQEQEAESGEQADQGEAE